MRGTRTLASWVIALFLAAMLLWVAVDTLAPPPGANNHLFQLLAETSDIAYFEPTGRFAVGVLEVLAALLVFLPATRRFGAMLSFLVLAFLAALIGQLMMLQIQIPVDTVGADGVVATQSTDPGAVFYLVLGLLVAALALIFVHPGKSREVAPRSYSMGAR